MGDPFQGAMGFEIPLETSWIIATVV